jgi:hypothetical protein
MRDAVTYIDGYGEFCEECLSLYQIPREPKNRDLEKTETYTEESVKPLLYFLYYKVIVFIFFLLLVLTLRFLILPSWGNRLQEERDYCLAKFDPEAGLKLLFMGVGETRKNKLLNVKFDDFELPSNIGGDIRYIEGKKFLKYLEVREFSYKNELKDKPGDLQLIKLIGYTMVAVDKQRLLCRLAFMAKLLEMVFICLFLLLLLFMWPIWGRKNKLN